MARLRNFQGVEFKKNETDIRFKNERALKPKPADRSMNALAGFVGEIGDFLNNLGDIRQAERKAAAKSGRGGGGRKGGSSADGDPNVRVQVPDWYRDMRENGPNKSHFLIDPELVGETTMVSEDEFDASGVDVQGTAEDNTLTPVGDGGVAVEDFKGEAKKIKTAIDQGKMTREEGLTKLGSRGRQLRRQLGTNYVEHEKDIQSATGEVTGNGPFVRPLGPVGRETPELRSEIKRGEDLGIRTRDLWDMSLPEVREYVNAVHVADINNKKLQERLRVQELRGKIGAQAKAAMKPRAMTLLQNEILTRTFVPIRRRLQELSKLIGTAQFDPAAVKQEFLSIKMALREAGVTGWSRPGENGAPSYSAEYGPQGGIDVANSIIKEFVEPYEEGLGANNVDALNAITRKLDLQISGRTEELNNKTGGKIVDRKALKEAGYTDQQIYEITTKAGTKDQEMAAVADALSESQLMTNGLTTEEALRAGKDEGLGVDADSTRRVLGTMARAIARRDLNPQQRADLSKRHWGSNGAKTIDLVSGVRQGAQNTFDYADKRIKTFDMLVPVDAVSATARDGSTEDNRLMGNFIQRSSAAALRPVIGSLVGDGFRIVLGENGKVTAHVPPNSPNKEFTIPRRTGFEADRPSKNPRGKDIRGPQAGDVAGPGTLLPAIGSFIGEVAGEGFSRAAKDLTEGSRREALQRVQKMYDKLVKYGEILEEPDPRMFAFVALQSGRAPGDIVLQEEFKKPSKLGGPEARMQQGGGVAFRAGGHKDDGVIQPGPGDFTGSGENTDSLMKQIDETMQMMRREPSIELLDELDSLRNQLRKNLEEEIGDKPIIPLS